MQRILFNSNKKISANIYLLITIAGAIIIFTTIGFRSFWIDEAMLALAVKATPIEHFVPLVLYEQATPILHFFTSKVVLYIFGDSDAWLRLPSILIFLISINIGVRMLY